MWGREDHDQAVDGINGLIGNFIILLLNIIINFLIAVVVAVVGG